MLLFLPEGEHHELGLLFIYYLLKSRGVRVFYLGANVPLKDLEYIVRVKNPSFIYTHLTSVANNFNFEKFLQNVSARLPNSQIIISGRLTQQYKKKLASNLKFKMSLQEVIEYIATL
jgi:methanogenic corrinoid protein MtbC1